MFVGLNLKVMKNVFKKNISSKMLYNVLGKRFLKTFLKRFWAPTKLRK